ncbi:MAG: 5-(carboxyamino)imidazole ribonucleotide synthase, partial [Solirubrobacteraceae bacterium]|nr:5-(carboxyamino)imidazole ribonucleotide synthase [Solirubrobacteraceae bacterium]
MSAVQPSTPLLPGATLGVLGGGQLGRMFAHAAQQLGYRTIVLDPEPGSPAGTVAHLHLQAGHLDEAGLDALADGADAVTTEFENVPAASLMRLAERVRVAPSGQALAVCQDRALEKAHFEQSGVAVAPYAVITSLDDLETVDERLLPGILKTATQGYDGKGQARVATRNELADAFRDLGEVRCVLEQRLDLAYEVSVIVARGSGGEVAMLPLQENVHVDGILATTTVPAPSATPQVEAGAQQAARMIAAALDFVGVLCVEFFVLTDGSLVANEMAPRPHNSGHYSIDACDISQFELQVRALAGLPLGEPRLLTPAVMINLLGDLWFDDTGALREPDWPAVLSLPGVHLHLYGKAEARRGRKMGHLTVTGGAPEVVAAVAAALG